MPGDAARRRAPELATHIAEGRARAALPPWSDHPGVSALHVKSLSRGHVAGMAATLEGGAVAAHLADRLERALASDAPWTACAPGEGPELTRQLSALLRRHGLRCAAGCTRLLSAGRC